MTARSRMPWRLLKWLAAMTLAGLTAGALMLGGLYLYLVPKLPEVDQLRDVQLQVPLRVYTRDDVLLAEYGAKRRLPLDIESIPDEVKNAFIAAEDNRFYEHPGVDWMGIVRAAWNLVLTGEKGQGGSTITMQVARNFFLSREKTYLRKLNEILLALKIEGKLSKAQILELYLNKIYLGEGAYGVGAAAQEYYGKTVDQLTVAEMAMIAGLPKAPSSFNPIANPQRARERRDYVLRRMRDNDMIDGERFRAASGMPVTATSHSAPIGVDAPYVGEMARLEAVQRFGDDVYTGGYQVYTSIDSQRQQAANEALQRALIDYSRRHGYGGPLARLDPRRVLGAEALKARLEAAEKDTDTDTGDGSAADSGDAGEDGSTPGSEGNEVNEGGKDSATAQAPLAAGRLGPAGLDTVLEQHAVLGLLTPAVVVAVDDKGATVYRREQGLGRIPWSGLKWAAPRGANGHVGAAPEVPADVVSKADIVYVTAQEESLQLAQLPKVQGALVSLDPDNGGIRSLVGGFSFERSHFNRVTQAKRQPGSNFKPFVYSAAINKGFTAATLVNDAPVVFDDPALEDTWRPENYSGRVFGPTRLREGLVHSRNLVSIRVLLRIGIPYAIDYVQRFGFAADQLPHDLTLALGSATVSPLQIAAGYAVFANMGFRVEPYLVTRMADGAGEVVYRANPALACDKACRSRVKAERAEVEAASTQDEGKTEGGDEMDSGKSMAEQDRPDKLETVGVPGREVVAEPRFAPRAIPERNAFIVRSLLRDVARRGTGRGTRVLGRDDLGGKTGTTDDQLDAWFSGFNSSVVTTAWVGHDELQTLGPSETGARAALPMWIDYMRTALKGTPETWPDLPSGMVTVRIDPETGDYAGAGVDKPMFEIFRRENAPEPPPAGASGGSGGSAGGESGGEPLF